MGKIDNKNKMKLSELFKINKNIVINADIDGFLSGMILQKYYNCKVVGFTDSKLCVWVSPVVNNIKDPIYIDLYVDDPEVICIDNHIIANNSRQTDEIKRYHRLFEYSQYKTKWNPNLDRNRNFADNYKIKYPFGTVHYLIALMAQDEKHIRVSDLSEEIIVRDEGGLFSITQGMILLRADDALKSSLACYQYNCSDWWNWLEDEYNSDTIYKIKGYLYSLDKQFDYNKNLLDRFFLEYLKSDGSDGSLKENNIWDSDHTVSDRLREYVEKLSDIMQMELSLPGKLDCYKGQRVKDFNFGYEKGFREENPLDYDIFSHAYVNSRIMRTTIGPMRKI